MLAGTLGRTSGRRSVGVGLRCKVKAHVASLEERAVLLIVRLLRGLRGLKVDVAEAARAAAVLFGDDASADDTPNVLELLVKSVVIDSPTEIANPEGRALLGSLAVRLGLLG